MLQDVPEQFPQVAAAMQDQEQAEAQAMHAMVAKTMLLIQKIAQSETDEDNKVNEVAVPPRTRAQYMSDLNMTQACDASQMLFVCSCVCTSAAPNLLFHAHRYLIYAWEQSFLL